MGIGVGGQGTGRLASVRLELGVEKGCREASNGGTFLDKKEQS